MFNLNIPKGRYPGESPGGWVVIEHMIYISALIPRRIDARIAGWSSGLACQADNLKVGGSNPSPATKTEVLPFKEHGDLTNNPYY